MLCVDGNHMSLPAFDLFVPFRGVLLSMNHEKSCQHHQTDMLSKSQTQSAKNNNMTRLRSVISGIDFYIICLLYFYNMTRYQTSPCDHRIIQPWRHGFQAQNGFERFTRPGDDSLLFSEWPF